MKEYKTDQIVVQWFPELCSHAAKCWQTLPEVFKPEEKPWINLEAATPEDLIKCIDKCPSAALQYYLPEGSKVDPNTAKGTGWVDYDKERAAIVKIRVINNGPLMVDGPTSLTSSDGKVIKEGSKLVLCRCGLSKNKPFCDGAHAREGWKAE
ncbi:MAG: (4Fe-4S)-binding protein [Ignavibacteriales bacterium]